MTASDDETRYTFDVDEGGAARTCRSRRRSKWSQEGRSGSRSSSSSSRILLPPCRRRRRRRPGRSERVRRPSSSAGGILAPATTEESSSLPTHSPVNDDRRSPSSSFVSSPTSMDIPPALRDAIFIPDFLRAFLGQRSCGNQFPSFLVSSMSSVALVVLTGTSVSHFLCSRSTAAQAATQVVVNDDTHQDAECAGPTSRVTGARKAMRQRKGEEQDVDG
mmetsp:Transcript_14318/g.27163  ORF Transcript_14318/g.27163 Transcript_14318/m.27163 type:complete len:219 (+) Transcript_14318:1969-2625(+)